MQFGVRAKRSCVHAITSVTDYMRESMDKKSSNQAFDSLDHSVLMNQLYSYGFRVQFTN